MTVAGLDRLRRAPYGHIVLGVLIVAITAPAFLVFNYVYRFGVNAVFWDEWKIVELFNTWDRGLLTWGDLFAPHSEHRIFVPQVLMFGLARLTHFNTLAPMYLSCAFLACAGVILLAEHVQAFGPSRASIALFVPSAWLIFTLRQSDNLLWGWQLSITAHVLSLALALYCLTRGARNRWAFPVAVLAGIITSLSFGAGMAVWPAGLVCMELSRASRPEESHASRLLQRTCWLVAAAALAIIYAHGYVKPEAHPSTTFALRSPGEGFFYLLVTLGGALTSSPDNAAGLGLLLLFASGTVVAMLAARGTDRGRVAFGAALLTYWLVVGILLTIGRAGFGAVGGTSSRYATMTMFGAVGCWRSVLAAPEGRGRTLLLGFVFAILCMGIFGSLNGALAEGFRQRDQRRIGATALRHYRDAKDADLCFLHPSAGYVRLYAPVLERLELNVFWGAKDRTPP